MRKVLAPVVMCCALTLATRFASADDEPKSRSTAIWLSAGGTSASVGLVALGVVAQSETIAGLGLLSSLVTPSAGEIYAGHLVTWGMAVRAASGGLLIAGTAEAFKCLGAHGTCHNGNGTAGLLLTLGAIGYAGGTLYDIATAGSAVDKYNQQLHLRVTPTVIPTTSGPGVGLGIGGSF